MSDNLILDIIFQKLNKYVSKSLHLKNSIIEDAKEIQKIHVREVLNGKRFKNDGVFYSHRTNRFKH